MAEQYPEFKMSIAEYRKLKAVEAIQAVLTPSLPTVDIGGETFGMDSSNLDSIGDQAKLTPIANQILSQGSLSFFAAQTFIGYQVSALIAQNWLINKACTIKVRDAVKSWYTPTINDGTDIDEDVIPYINKMDKRFGLRKNLLEAGRFNNIFGIRHVLFEVDGIDYEKPFNPDGIKPGAYKGITQIDPYWCTPYLGMRDAADPASQHFYEPSHWFIGGRGKIHRSHFVIMRGPEVADYLKPAYYYGGIGLPQLIFERAYASERTANEVPQVAMAKRLNVRKVDLEKVATNPAAFSEAMVELTEFRDNFGVHVIDKEEEFQQFDTSLTDFDAAVMTQYQLCAAISSTPATKLLGTSPKGFNATGEHEIASYHEELENIQEMDLSPIVERHHLCLMRSHVTPKFGEDFEVDIVWNPLNIETRKEKAEINDLKSQTFERYINAGAVSQEEVRTALINDPDSGFDGLEMIDQDDLDIDDLDDDSNVSTTEDDYDVLTELSEDEDAEDAEYQGSPVTLNKPFRDKEGGKKFAVYVKNDKGNVIKVRFGDANMEIKRDDPQAKANFRSRHGCSEKTDKTKAGYWSCKMWSGKNVSDIT